MDVKYLATLGIRVFEDVTTAFMERIDTAKLYRIIRSELNQRSLASILGELGIIGWNLHNAGNDARYTLEALVRMICCDTGEVSVAASTVE
jgi:DNA polymerase III alpha subunit (gram-positive type)